MDYVVIDLTIASARDLKSVSLLGKNQPFAVAYVDPIHKCTTKVAIDGGSNPVWNERHYIQVPESALQRGDAILTIEIYSRGTLGNKIIGTVHIPVADIIKDGKDGTTKYVTYQVQRRSGRTRGSLSVIAKVVEETGRTIVQKGVPMSESVASPDDAAIMAYPAYASMMNSSYAYQYPVNPYPAPYYYPLQYPSCYPELYPQGSFYPLVPQ